MTEILTAAQMRAIETAGISAGEVTGLELMERAGRGVVEAVFEEWPELAAAPHRAAVLCGPGNNGGDGFVVARLLKEWGWEVEVYLYGDPDRLPPDAKVNYERWRELGTLASASDLVRRLSFPEFDADHPDISLFVDAGFGTGLTRAIPDDMIQIAQSLNEPEEPEKGKGWIVAVDIPSGLCSDSGKIIGHNPDAVFYCDLSVSFHSFKIGHIIQDGPDICGKVKVVDIGL